jgi:hypothetical protein
MLKPYVVRDVELDFSHVDTMTQLFDSISEVMNTTNR